MTTTATVAFVIVVPRNLPLPHALPQTEETDRALQAVRESVALQARANLRARGFSRNINEKRAVTLTLLRGKDQAMLDDRDCADALTVVVDALIDAGWIAADTPALLDLTLEQERNEAVGPAVAVEVSVVAV